MQLPENIPRLLEAGAASGRRNFLTDRDPVVEAEFAGWNAAVSIEDYMGWCVEGYDLNRNMHGEPYRTEADDDEALVELVSDLYAKAIALSGLGTVRYKRPSIAAIMDRNPHLEDPRREAAFTKKFYGMLKIWHHGARMNERTVTRMLDQLPPCIDVLSYVDPDMRRNCVTRQAFIAMDLDVTPSADRPFGQRGGGRTERPRNPADGRKPDARVPIVGRQIIHIATNQDRFDFMRGEGVGYLPHRGLEDDSTEKTLSDISWSGWESQPWVS